jgi:hypothetical protein
MSLAQSGCMAMKTISMTVGTIVVMDIVHGSTIGEPKCFTSFGHCPLFFDNNDSIAPESNYDSNVIDSILI